MAPCVCRTTSSVTFIEQGAVILAGMKRYAVALLPFAILAAVAGSGSLDWLERHLQDLRFRLVRHDASDRFVLVEIDEPSLNALNVWPWPRTYYATAVDQLVAGGATVVALDIDLSAHSTPDADAALAAALARAGRKAILPAFKQPIGMKPSTSQIAETRPIDIFARHVSLASVVVHPDVDSRVRRMESVTSYTGGALPSMALALGANGRAVPAVFEIDYGIRPETIPRISFVDLIRGRYPPGFFQGRAVLVGATAIQLGDQLSVPVHITLPGSVVTSLAVESIRQGRALLRPGMLPTLVGCLIVMLLLWGPMGRWELMRGMAAACATSGGILMASILVQAVLPISSLTAPLLLAPWLAFTRCVFAVLDRQATRLFRQRMEARQRDLIMRQIVENAFEAIVVVEQSGTVLMHNTAAERLFCRESESLVGRSAQSLLRVFADDAGTTVPVLALLDGNESPARLLEGIAVNGWGDDVPIELSVRQAVVHPEAHRLERRRHPRTFHFISARDISERRRADAAIRHALQNAEAASEAKSRFLATISHELRTPLNAVIGFSEMIKEQSFGPVGNARYCEYAKDIHQSGRHLLDLINDILDVTRVESGDVDIEESEIDVAACVASTMRRLVPQLTVGRREVRVQAKGVPLLIADRRLIEQVLLNLVSNAIKFTPGDGDISIVAGLRDDGGITLSVVDTGIGIPDSELPKLGRPFYQVDQSHTRKFGGAGLGLTIVHGLVELHGGSVRISSSVGVGTTVACDFPPSRTCGDFRASA